jgi:hypothetical protein
MRYAFTFDILNELNLLTHTSLKFGVNKTIQLKPNGDSIPVTEDNKKEFVQLSAKYRLVSSIEEQISNLSQGFYEIVPKELITIVSTSIRFCPIFPLLK